MGRLVTGLRPSAYLVPVVVDVGGGVVRIEQGVEVGASDDGMLDPDTLTLAVAEVLLVSVANLVASIDPVLADHVGAALDHLDSI